MIWCSVLEWGQNAVVLPPLTFLCTFALGSFCFLISYGFAIYNIFTRSLCPLCYIQRLILASCKGCVNDKIVFHSYLYTGSSEVILCCVLRSSAFIECLVLCSALIVLSDPCAKTELRTDGILLLPSWHEWNEFCALGEWLTFSVKVIINEL